MAVESKYDPKDMVRFLTSTAEDGMLTVHSSFATLGLQV